jgi:hypothetical protein
LFTNAWEIYICKILYIKSTALTNKTYSDKELQVLGERDGLLSEVSGINGDVPNVGSYDD